MNMKRFIILLLACWPLIGMTGVYKWVDDEGRVHYGDQPGSNSNVTHMPEFDVKSSPAADEPVIADPEPAAPGGTPGVYKFPELFGDGPALQGVSYSIRITTPLQDDTVRDNQGIIPVAFTTSPMPEDDFSYQMYLDGMPWFQPFFSQQVYLSNVDRGTHTIQVKLMNGEGAVVGESNSVTFHLHRASALNRGPR
jgi:hypothetical protein